MTATGLASRCDCRREPGFSTLHSTATTATRSGCRRSEGQDARSDRESMGRTPYRLSGRRYPEWVADVAAAPNLTMLPTQSPDT